MLHGDVIPVTRNTVEFGQAPLNGDIVQMPGYPTDWDIILECDECGDFHNKRITCEEVAYYRDQEAECGWILDI